MRLRDNWPEKGLLGKIGRELNIIAKQLNGMVGFNGIEVRRTTSGINIFGSSSASDLSRFSFGWLGTDGATAIIRGGIFKSYGQYIRVGRADTSGNRVSCGGNKNARHLIVVEARNGSASILANSIPEASFSGDTADALYQPIYAVYLENGRVVLDEIIHVGGVAG